MNQENTNWWEDAYWHDWHFKSLWQNPTKVREARLSRVQSDRIEQLSPIELRVSLPTKGRQVTKPDQDQIFVKRDYKHTVEW